MHMGATYVELERHNDAARELGQARARFASPPLGPDPFNIAKTQLLPARNHHACGRLREAIGSLDSAEAGMREEGSDFWTGRVLELRGRFHREAGDRTRAVEDWAAARMCYRKAKSEKGAAEMQSLLEEEGEE
ncbi:hypothetical protein [Streptomyces sp. KLOTTS4A1]|uniref:hypothetical protein n=1 Tax=Streptomyces sp. KLOTTS4A1 TaxID=3390996 RepID=UPI0039F511A4